MTLDLAANLRDTFPGRLSIAWHLDWHTRQPEFDSAERYADSIETEEYSSLARMTLSMYLYGADFKDVADMDTSEPAILEMSEAIATALASSHRQTLHTPQIHHGDLNTLRPPIIANRRSPSSLPDGAFWTAPVFDSGGDAWLLHGEHNPKRSPNRYQVHFNPELARIARIDSADDWIELLSAHPFDHNGTLFPDWPSIAQAWDAVHVSISGLLCAQPRISQVPYTGGDLSGYTHSRSGPYAGVGDWSVPSTAWLRVPPGEFTIQPMVVDREQSRPG